MKFEEIKNMTAWEVLKLLQKKTRRNAALIKENSVIIQSVLKGKVELHDGKFNVAEVQSKNNELIKENAEYLKLHNKLLSFMQALQKDTKVNTDHKITDQLKFENVEPELKDKSLDDLFNEIISGKAEYNKNHPYYDSKEFRARLVDYYSEREEYEKCALLVNN